MWRARYLVPLWFWGNDLCCHLVVEDGRDTLASMVSQKQVDFTNMEEYF